MTGSFTKSRLKGMREMMEGTERPWRLEKGERDEKKRSTEQPNVKKEERGRQRGALIATEVPAYVMSAKKHRRSGEHETGLGVSATASISQHHSRRYKGDMCDLGRLGTAGAR